MKADKYQILFSGRARDPARLLRRLREEERSTIEETLRRAPKGTKERIMGGPGFGRRPNELFWPYEAGPTSTLRGEIQWISISLSGSAEKLAEQSTELDQFLRHLLSGGHEAALATIMGVEESFGLSLVVHQCRFALAQYGGGLTANREYLSKIQKESEGLERIVLEFLSQRVESETSYAQYVGNVNHKLAVPESMPEARDLARWVRFRVCPLSLTDLADPERLLWGEEHLPHIDRLNGLIRLLGVLASRRDGDPLELPASFASLAQNTRSASLEPTFIAAAMGRCALPEGDARENALNSIINDYTVGRYAQAAKDALEVVVEYPDALDCYEVYVNACAHLGVRAASPFAKGSLGSSIIETLESCVLRRDHAASTYQLAKLATVLDSFSIGRQLAAFCLGQNRLVTPLRASRLAALTSSRLTPRYAYSFAEEAKAFTFLERFQNEASSVFESVLKRDPAVLSRHLPATRRLKYEGSALLARDQAAEALKCFEQLHDAAANIPPTLHLAKVGRIRALLAMREYLASAELVVLEYLAESPYLDGLPLRYLVNAIESQRQTPSIIWPLFWRAYFDVTRTPISKRRRIYEAYDDYLKSRGAKTPSELLKNIENIDKKHLIPFLSKVCVLETMDSSRHIKGTAVLEEERIHICQALEILDPANAAIYKDEASVLLGRAAVREIFQQVDNSRIYVNTQGIKESLDETFADNFVRFRAYTNLSAYLRKSTANADFEKALSRPSVRSQQLQDAATQILFDLFQDIGRRYLSSDEYGLDSFLSARIRHGVLSSQIRSPFEAQHLITQRPKAEAAYERNMYWLQRIGDECGRAVAERCTRPLQEFSAAVDELIRNAKDKKIRLRESRTPEGLFDYSFESEELTQLYSRAASVSNAEALLELFYKTLWERTVRNLSLAVAYLREELTGALLERLLLLETQLQSSGVPPNAAVVAAIRSCLTSIPNEIENIAGWFTVVRSAELPKFTVTDAFATLIEKVRKVMPTYDLQLRQEIDSGLELRGAILSSFFDLMLILLDNAVRYSGRAEPHVRILVRRNSKTISIEVENTLNNTFELAQRAASIVNNESTTDVSGASTEGGSGLKKLRKILTYDMRLGTNYGCSAVASEEAFVIKLELPSELVLP